MMNTINFSQTKNKKKLAAFLGMALLSSVMSFEASAKVSPKYLSQVSKYYKQDKKYFSLIFGQVALDNGLIHNLRFLGVEKPGVTREGNRKYAEDTSSDPLVQLVIELFPSPGGNLAPLVDVKENFGKSATVETVASLLKYANEIRKNKKISDIKKPQPFPKGSSHTQTERNARNDEIRRYETIYKKSTENIKNSFSKIILAQNKNMNKKALNSILTKVIESIEKETSSHSFYTKHTTEQILTAFFNERFNNDDVEKLVNILDDDIVAFQQESTNRINFQKSLLTIEELNGIAKKNIEEPYDIDEIYTLANAYIFFALTPYTPGTTPVSNGSGIRPYNQITGQLDEGGFADCEETSLRHILNLMIFDGEKKTFDLSVLDQLQLKDSILEKIKAFYAQQTPDRANEGDELRNLWNQVVGDLNHLITDFQSPKVEYAQQTSNGAQYELKANIINSIRVFQKLFKVELPEIPIDSVENKKKWIEKSLITIFKKINSKKNYDVNASRLVIDPGDIEILSGPLTIRVFEEHKPLFSFDYISEKEHSYISTIESACESADFYHTAIKQHKINFMDQEMEQSIWTIDSRAFEDKITQPLYKLFHQRISDNNSRLKFLKTVCDKYDDWEKGVFSLKEGQKHFNTFLKNVLGGISWETQYNIADAFSRMTFELSKKDALKRSIYDNVKRIHIESSQDLEDARKFNVLELLYFSYNPELNKIYVSPNFKTVKNIRFSSVPSFIELTGLENLPNLEILDLLNADNLTKIAFESPLEKLKSLILIGSAISELTGLENVPNLEELYLSSTTNLQKLASTAPLEKLIRVDLSSSPMKYLEEFDFRKESFDFEASYLSASIDDFKTKAPDFIWEKLSALMDLYVTALSENNREEMRNIRNHIENSPLFGGINVAFEIMNSFAVTLYLHEDNPSPEDAPSQDQIQALFNFYREELLNPTSPEMAEKILQEVKEHFGEDIAGDLYNDYQQMLSQASTEGDDLDTPQQSSMVPQYEPVSNFEFLNDFGNNVTGQNKEIFLSLFSQYNDALPDNNKETMRNIRNQIECSEELGGLDVAFDMMNFFAVGNYPRCSSMEYPQNLFGFYREELLNPLSPEMANKILLQVQQVYGEDIAGELFNEYQQVHFAANVESDDEDIVVGHRPQSAPPPMPRSAPPPLPESAPPAWPPLHFVHSFEENEEASQYDIHGNYFMGMYENTDERDSSSSEEQTKPKKILKSGSEQEDEDQ